MIASQQRCTSVVISFPDVWLLKCPFKILFTFTVPSFHIDPLLNNLTQSLMPNLTSAQVRSRPSRSLFSDSPYPSPTSQPFAVSCATKSPSDAAEACDWETGRAITPSSYRNSACLGRKILRTSPSCSRSV